MADSQEGWKSSEFLGAFWEARKMKKRKRPKEHDKWASADVCVCVCVCVWVNEVMVGGGAMFISKLQDCGVSFWSQDPAYRNHDPQVE